MTYSPELLDALDPFVRALMEALGWDFPGGYGSPSADEVVGDIAESLRERFTITPRGETEAVRLGNYRNRLGVLLEVRGLFGGDQLGGIYYATTHDPVFGATTALVTADSLRAAGYIKESAA